jgi:hypothetical protein
MEFAYDLSGGSTAFVKKYQVAASNTVLGVPYLQNAGSGGTGIVLGTTTGAANALGVNIDVAGTYVTAQQTDNSDTQRLTSVIVNPHAVYRALIAGSATSGAALTLYTAVSGGSDGLTIVMDSSVASPDMDETYFFCLSGTNTSKKRKCTSTSSTTATFIVAWPLDVVAGDTFISCGFTPTQTEALTLTTDLTGIRGDLAPTGAAFNCIEAIFDSRTTTYGLIQFGDHCFAGRPT